MRIIILLFPVTFLVLALLQTISSSTLTSSRQSISSFTTQRKKFLSLFEENNNLNNKFGIKCATSGFATSSRGMKFLQTLMKDCGFKRMALSGTDRLDKFEMYERDDVNGEELSKAIAVCAVDDAIESLCDVGMLYFPENALLNENELLLRIQNLLKALLGPEDEPKKSLVLVMPSTLSGESLAKHMKICNTIVNGVWTMMNKESFRSDDLTAEFNVVTETITTLSASSLAPLISNAFDTRETQGSSNGIGGSTRSITSLFKDSISDKVSKYYFLPQIHQQAQGFDSSKEGVSLGLDWARRGATASMQRLRQPLTSDTEFVGFVENLLNGAIDIMKKTVENQGGASSASIKLAESEMKNAIMTMMLPFFKIQVQFSRQDIITAFNTVVVDEIEISVDIMKDLFNAKKDALSKFAKALSKLTPKGAPSSWGSEFELQQLDEILEDYIKGREVQSKIQGVLPRGRKPIDFSVHYFLTHPFGRDYRQDLLGSDRDTFFYDDAAAASKEILVHPAIARSILSKQNKENNPTRNGPSIARIEYDSEFAREMLMFPLSIKNPEVPLVGGRSSRRKGGPPKKDPLRESLGPERFIRWDIDPMDIVLEDLQGHVTDVKKAQGSINNGKFSFDKVLDVFPFFGPKYEHPAINYSDKDYGPSLLN